MRRIDCGTSGAAAAAAGPRWDDLGLPPPWPRVLDVLAPGPAPTPVQALALADRRILGQRRNLLVSAPTNAGKSLIGLLTLLDAIRRGQRGLLLEPLRAVAREKADGLRAARPALAKALGIRLRVRLTTGDYRLDRESFLSPPPGTGELVIATPERLDAVLRNPAHDPWLAGLGAVVADEAHLIRTPGRGATLEGLLTAFLCLPCPPRLALLSASLGDLGRAEQWLAPCDVVRVTERRPPLHKAVWALTASESADDAAGRLLAEALAGDGTQALVFVYQTRSAEALADRLGRQLGPAAGPDGALAYHAQMPAARREAVRTAFLAGRCRCAVTTTALALGVNLPATHVLVRDSHFPGVGPLPAEDLLQMMGRAGRGDRVGHAAVLVRATDPRPAESLARALRAEQLPPFTSSLESVGRAARGVCRPAGPGADAAPLVLARLARRPGDGTTADELRQFFARSLGADRLTACVAPALAWLADPRRALAHRDESGRYRPTALGLSAARSLLPPAAAAGCARLLRDLLSLDPDDELLTAWQPIDHLIVLELTCPHSAPGLRFSERLAGRVDAWMAAGPGRASCLYREWIAGSDETSRASQVLGSLDMMPGRGPAADARRTAYLAAVRAVLLYERGQGTAAADLGIRWGVPGLEGVDERWRDDLLWLLAGMASLLEVRCFYHHLKEACGADAGRVRRVRAALRRLRGQAFALREGLKKCP